MIVMWDFQASIGKVNVIVNCPKPVCRGKCNRERRNLYQHLCQVVEVCASIRAMYCGSYSCYRGFDSYLGLFQGVLARCIRTGYCDFEPEVLRTAFVKTSEWVEEVCDENIGEERDSGYRVVSLVS